MTLKVPNRPSVLIYGLGLAGLIPFVGLAALSWVPEIMSESFSGRGLASYAAVILSFLGAIYWGLAMSGTQAIQLPIGFGSGVYRQVFLPGSPNCCLSFGRSYYSAVCSGCVLLLTESAIRDTNSRGGYRCGFYLQRLRVFPAW